MTTIRLLFLFLLLLPWASLAHADMVRVTVSLANIRAEPGTHYKIIGSAKKGQLLPVVDSTKEWWKVKIKDGTEAWIYKNAVKVEKEDYHTLIEVMVKETLGDYMKWATLNEVYLEEYQTARLDVMVTPEWSRLDQEQQKSIMMHLAREFSRLCEDDQVLKAQNRVTPYVAFFDRFNTLIGKANKSDTVFSD